MNVIYFVSTRVRKIFDTHKRIFRWRPRTIVVGFFAFVIIGHVFYGEGGLGIATAFAGLREAFISAFSWILYGFAKFLGLLGVAGATLFVYILDVDVVHSILGSPIIDVVWTIVRDVLNLSFILILLFSAFATIFQVEKYHLRKILVRLVIMALLVNFSLPIAKVIIDASNIIMYFFVNNLFPNSATGTGFEIPEIFGKSLNIVDVFVPQHDPTATTLDYLFVTIIFAFFYGISMITIAGMLLVRLVALAILLIFSPIGFVAMILPSTQSYASQWWSSLLRYAFTGPILVFILFFAMSFMSYTHDVAFNKNSEARIAVTADIATVNADQTSNLSNIVFLMIPIVILWSGIMATSLASDGASKMVTQWGRGVAAKTGRKLRGGGRYMVVGGVKGVARGADNLTGNRVTGRIHQYKTWRKNAHEGYKKRVEDRAEIYSAGKKGRGAVEARQFARALGEATKELQHFTHQQLLDEAENGSSPERRVAAARLAAQKGAISGSAEMDIAMRAMQSAPEMMRGDLEKDVQSSVRKEGRRDIVAQYRINKEAKGLDSTQRKDKVAQIVKEEYRVGAEELGKQRAFKELDVDARTVLTEHIDQNIIVDSTTIRDAAKNGNAEELSRVSEKFKRGVGFDDVENTKSDFKDKIA